MTGDALSPELKATYDRRFAGKAAYRQAVWKVLTRTFFQQFVPSGAAVLDLGCGWGEFINHIEARRKYGMDLNPSSPEHLSPDVVFLHQDCSTRWALEDASLDVVFTSNFFEHLPDKPSLRRTVEHAHRALKPGGRLICLGPNVKCLAGPYWDFWDHHVPLSEASLRELLELSGYRVDRCVARFLPYTMASGVEWPAAFVAVYVACPWVWPLLGRQFLVVATRL